MFSLAVDVVFGGCQDSQKVAWLLWCLSLEGGWLLGLEWEDLKGWIWMVLTGESCVGEGMGFESLECPFVVRCGICKKSGFGAHDG